LQNFKKQTKKKFGHHSEKTLPGPDRRVRARWVVGSAGVYNSQFWSAWDKIRDGLLAANSSEEVLNAINASGGLITIPANDPSKFSSLILDIIKDPSFPKLRKKSQIRFLSDSLGANGLLTPRRSRDVCYEERAKAKRPHHIVRYEYFIECSCGYEGNSQYHACAKCGAPIVFPVPAGV